MFSRRSTGTQDRREAQRQQVAYRLDVVGEDGAVGCMLDVSATGMRVRFKRAPDIREIDGLRILFPRWLELGNALPVSGRFVWVRAARNGATDAGFAFDGLSRKEESLLEVLIQRLAEAQAEDQEDAT